MTDRKREQRWEEPLFLYLAVTLPFGRDIKKVKIKKGRVRVDYDNPDGYRDKIIEEEIQYYFDARS